MLLARLDSMGDVLLAGPAVRAVAETASHVTLLVARGQRATAELLPGVDAVLEFTAPWVVLNPPPVDPAEMQSLVATLAAGRFDAALVLTSYHQSPLPLALLLRMAGVGWVGAASEDYPGSLLDLRHRPVDGLPEPERALQLARAAGFGSPASSARLAVAGPLPGPDALAGPGPYVVLHPGAAVAARATTPTHARALVEALVAAGHRVVVTGGPGDHELTAAAAADGLASDLGGRLSLRELAAVLAGARAVVAVNTGPAHLAAAVGTPVVSLFAPVVAASAWAPLRRPRRAARRPGRRLPRHPGPHLPRPRAPLPDRRRAGRGGRRRRPGGRPARGRRTRDGGPGMRRTGPLVVVGDSLLDVDLSGTSTRLAPDAPVPVVDLDERWERPGGAGLAALLAARSGLEVVLVTALAEDPAAARLEELLGRHVAVEPLRWIGETVVKTRVGAHGVPMLRLDSGGGHPAGGVLPRTVHAVLGAAGAVLVADYGRGLTALPALRRRLEAVAADVPVVWDPHPRGAAPVAGVALATPNAAEARHFGAEGDALERAAWLCRHWEARAVAVTQGERGAVLSRGGGQPGVEVPLVGATTGTGHGRPDTCGAGDQFAASATAALLAGADADDRCPERGAGGRGVRRRRSRRHRLGPRPGLGRRVRRGWGGQGAQRRGFPVPGRQVSERPGPVVGEPAPRFLDVRRIAVLRGGGLGDLVFALPAAEALAAAYPDAELTLLGAPGHAALLADRPSPFAGVEVLPVRPGVRDGVEDPAATAAFLARMRARRFDLAVQVHGGGGNSNPFLLALGARHTVGLQVEGAPALERTVPYLYYQHEVLRALEVAALAGASAVDLEPRLRLTPTEQEVLAAPAEGPPLVVLHPGATDPRRRWPPASFAAVAGALAADGAEVVVVGDASEVGLAEELLAAVDPAQADRVRTTAGRASLSDLVELLLRAAVVVANDSGPRHVAAALGVPTVGVYWFGNALNAGALSRGRHRLQLAWTTHCPVCGADVTVVGMPRCRHDVSFVADVGVDAVLADARALLARRQRPD